MIYNRIFRFIHTDNALWQVSEKSLLAKLRKKTGYTFSNCKKALEMHQNDLQKAEAWLREQAQVHGWTQAAKLEGRKTKEGLIAAIVDKSCAALVEINCETDFVARNKKFHGLAETIAAAVLNHSPVKNTQEINKIHLSSDVIKALPAADGKTLADHTALIIGSLGENIMIRRALCLNAQPDITLYGCTHPATVNSSLTSFGRYGALLALKSNDENKQLGIQLCQHIIGMNPLKIGNAAIDEPNKVADDETCMIYQEFLLDPNISVQQALREKDAEIVDFARFEIGETLELEQSLDSVETCG